MYVYSNHRPSVIWLRIRSSIKLSMYHSSNLQAERCFTSMFTWQTHLLFTSLSWFRLRNSICDVLSRDPHWASWKRGFTTTAYLRPICSGAHSSTNTVLAMGMMSRVCLLKSIDGGVIFAMTSIHPSPMFGGGDIKRKRILNLSHQNYITYFVVFVTPCQTPELFASSSICFCNRIYSPTN